MGGDRPASRHPCKVIPELVHSLIPGLYTIFTLKTDPGEGFLFRCGYAVERLISKARQI